MIYQKGDLLLIKSLNDQASLNLWVDHGGIEETIVLDLPVTFILLESVDTKDLPKGFRYIKVLTFEGAGTISSGWFEVLNKANITLLSPAGSNGVL